VVSAIPTTTTRRVRIVKICIKCKSEKTKDSFGKLARSKDGLQSSCRECKAAYCADYRAANIDKKKASEAAYRSANREKMRASSAAWRASNPSKSKACDAAYRYANAEKTKERTAAWRNANKEEVIAYREKYKAVNKDRFIVYCRNRIARKRNAEGSHTAADIRSIFERQHGICANCETILIRSGNKKYHVDHIMPLALGGSNWPDNLQCLCKKCNLSKGAKHPVEWAAENGRLI